MGRGVYFRSTTSAQRHLLFATWEATGDVEEACAAAHVGRRTFYYWKVRFEVGAMPHWTGMPVARRTIHRARPLRWSSR